MIGDDVIVLRLLLAAVLGSIIGVERERLSWAAGLRTHMLVCVGATLVMIVSAFGFSDILGTAHVDLDPSRMAAQVVSGIGFLGAGSILLRGEIVRGLTTAASLWTVAAVGLAVGGGMYVAATAATVIILIILAGLKPIEERVRATKQSAELEIQASHGELSLALLGKALGYTAGKVRQFVVQPSEVDAIDQISITLSPVSRSQVAVMIQELKKLPCVHEIHETKRPE